MQHTFKMNVIISDGWWWNSCFVSVLSLWHVAHMWYIKLSQIQIFSHCLSVVTPVVKKLLEHPITSSPTTATTTIYEGQA